MTLYGGSRGAAAGVDDWQEYVSEWSRLHGGFDPERSAPVVRAWLRLAYRLARLAGAARLSPSGVTTLGLLLSVTVPLLVLPGAGWPIAAGLVVVVSAAADSADGALAIISRRVTRFGSVYDSMADRVAEACWLVAFARLGAAPALVAVCGGLAWLHEYVRARAAAVGMTEIGSVTVGERPTRVLIAAFGLIFAGLGGLAIPDLAVGTVTTAGAIWAVLQGVALLQLLAAVHRGLQ